MSISASILLIFFLLPSTFARIPREFTHNDHSAIKTGWNVRTYPDWRLDAKDCRFDMYQASGWICDPDGVLREQDRWQLHTHMTAIREHTRCACQPSTMCHPGQHGFTVSIAIILNRRGKPPPKQKKRGVAEKILAAFGRQDETYNYMYNASNHFDQSSTDLQSSYQLSAFTHRLHERIEFAQCGDGVLIVLVADDYDERRRREIDGTAYPTEDPRVNVFIHGIPRDAKTHVGVDMGKVAHERLNDEFVESIVLEAQHTHFAAHQFTAGLHSILQSIHRRLVDWQRKMDENQNLEPSTAVTELFKWIIIGMIGGAILLCACVYACATILPKIGHKCRGMRQQYDQRLVTVGGDLQKANILHLDSTLVSHQQLTNEHHPSSMCQPITDGGRIGSAYVLDEDDNGDVVYEQHGQRIYQLMTVRECEDDADVVPLDDEELAREKVVVPYPEKLQTSTGSNRTVVRNVETNRPAQLNITENVNLAKFR